MSEYFFPSCAPSRRWHRIGFERAGVPAKCWKSMSGAVLCKHAFLAPILDPVVFARVHLGEWGSGSEWLDAEFGSENVYAWAKEQVGEVSHEMFGEWMYRKELSLTTPAEALGISRRMVSYWRTAHKAIRRAIWLACLGWEATRPHDRALPRVLPTAREYAALHA